MEQNKIACGIDRPMGKGYWKKIIKNNKKSDFQLPWGVGASEGHSDSEPIRKVFR